MHAQIQSCVCHGLRRARVSCDRRPALRQAAAAKPSARRAFTSVAVGWPALSANARPVRARGVAAQGALCEDRHGGRRAVCAEGSRHRRSRARTRLPAPPWPVPGGAHAHSTVYGRARQSQQAQPTDCAGCARAFIARLSRHPDGVLGAQHAPVRLPVRTTYRRRFARFTPAHGYRRACQSEYTVMRPLFTAILSSRPRMPLGLVTPPSSALLLTQRPL